ncbi:MAG: iron ABC transporter permease [Gammaproteobacteria bacterium]|nr:iron ABC transporter permease [Gammaproteobacteria bacterium]
MVDALTPPRRRPARTLLVLIVIALLCLGTGLSLGTYPIGLSDYMAYLHGDNIRPASRILQELRLPRVLSGFTTGGLLALAGVLMQVLLRNPLAEPYVLGISGGASVLVLVLMLLGVSAVYLPLGAMSGAVVSIVLVTLLARGAGSWTPTRLLLTGVILASGWGAIITLILSIAPEHHLRGMLYWLMGDLQYSTGSWTVGLILAGVLLWCGWHARGLNLLALGSLQAATLGVAVDRLQWQLIGMASLLTALAVMQAGNIGFIGLIIPHSLRLLGLQDHRYLLPAAVISGGGFLVLADAVARSLFTTVSLPVGVITALVGVPIFLVLLQRNSAHTA